MSHKGHPACPHTSKAACEKARRIAIGQCSAMLEETRECPHWGIDKVDDRAYCGQHLPAIFRAADDTKRSRARREELDSRIDDYLTSRGFAPHVCGPHCEFSLIGGK